MMRFLSLTSILAAGLVSTGVADPCGSPKEADVTIVGGGLAGIFAALVLDKAGISYNLLESSDTWGGRLRSAEASTDLIPASGDPAAFGDFRAEEGAQFMYGKTFGAWRVNPIWRLFDGFGLETFDYDDRDWATYNETGGLIDDALVQDLITTMQKSVKECLDKSGNAWFDEWLEGIQTPDKSAEDILKDCFPWKWESDTPLKTAISHVLAGELENALRLDEISRASYPEDSYDHYGTELFTQYGQEGGSTSVVNALVDDKLDDTSVHLETKVTSIEGFGELETTVMAEVGGCTQEFKSEFVILAVPTNILKGLGPGGNDISITPGLDNLDDHPIEQNKVENVWIKFSEPFWDESRVFIVVTNELAGGASTLFFNYNSIFPESNILLAFVDEKQQEDMGGAGTIVVDTVIQDLKNLDAWHGGITYDAVKSDWQGDPNFGGGWEIWKKDKTYADFEKYLMPQGNLHKAGAGNCLNLWGFTWGAILSGVKEAEWILNRIDQPGSPIKELQPYSACEDTLTVSNADYKDFYRKYGTFFEPGP